jgi:hypothetical protein
MSISPGYLLPGFHQADWIPVFTGMVMAGGDRLPDYLWIPDQVGNDNCNVDGDADAVVNAVIMTARLPNWHSWHKLPGGRVMLNCSILN